MLTFSRLAAKFGGTSVRDAKCIKNVRTICVGSRQFVVVSAPAGVTNSLIEWVGGDPELRSRIWNDLRARFGTIVSDLNVDLDIEDLFEQIDARIKELEEWIAKGWIEKLWLEHFVRSRGEWVNAQIIAKCFGYRFVDAAEFVVFDTAERYQHERTLRAAGKIKLAQMVGGVVIPGFYGRVAGKRNMICTFSRGGSDITGAIVAALVHADVYENWTDVPGILAADPRIVENPRLNSWMTFKELRELSFMGAKVFHEDAVAIVRNAGIPIHIRCTHTPTVDGTMVSHALPVDISRPTVTGVASKNGFSAVIVEKYGLNDSLGIKAQAELVFAKYGVGVDTSSSIDSVTFVVSTKEVEPHRQVISDILQRRFRPDNMFWIDDLSLVCTVGEGMRDQIGISARVSGALAHASINIELELQGGSQINIMRGVARKDEQNAVRAITEEFLE